MPNTRAGSGIVWCPSCGSRTISHSGQARDAARHARRRWYPLLLPMVFALQMGFDLLDLLTLHVIEFGGILLDRPPEAELRTDGQLLRDVLLHVLLSLEPRDRRLDQSLLPDRVVADDGDHVTVTMGGNLHDTLVGEHDLHLAVLHAPGARQGRLVALLVVGRRRQTDQGEEAAGQHHPVLESFRHHDVRPSFAKELRPLEKRPPPEPAAHSMAARAGSPGL